MSLTMEERVTRYETMRREGRLLRNAWSDADAEGRERACWLAALAPEVVAAHTARECPADVMPQWLAHIVPDLDDCVSDEAWSAMAKRFGRCAARWHALDAGAWARVKRTVLLEAVILAREAVTVDQWGVLPAIDEVLKLLREGGSQQEWAAARAAADAARAAARAAADAARAAAHAARAAAHAARADAAARAASGAASTGACSASAAAAVYYGASGSVAAWDRIATALFDAIEREILNA